MGLCKHKHHRRAKQQQHKTVLEICLLFLVLALGVLRILLVSGLVYCLALMLLMDLYLLIVFLGPLGLCKHKHHRRAKQQQHKTVLEICQIKTSRIRRYSTTKERNKPHECINILAIYNVISGSTCDMLSLINYIFFITPLLCANLFGMTEHL
jgi:hypothetical protein